MDINYQKGIPENLKSEAVEIILEALGDKIVPIIGNDSKTRKILESSINPTHCIAAVSGQKLLGILTLQSGKNHFIRPTLKTMIEEYKFFGGIIRKIGFSLLNHLTKANEFYIYGVAVSKNSRGMGIGSKLFELLNEIAIKNGIKKLSLQVIDTNPRAEALYQRLGFVVKRRLKIWPVNKIIGWPFAKTTLMVKELN